MSENIPYKLATIAFEKKELSKFLIGDPPYDFVEQFSPAPGSADLSDLIYEGLWPYLNDHCNKENIDYLKLSLKEIIDFPLGMYAVASFILQTSIYKKKNSQSIDFDLKDISLELKRHIHNKEQEISEVKIKLDPRLNLYETLQILSKNTQSVGGPSFFSAEDNQDESIKL